MFPCSECDSIFMLTGCLCTQSEIWHYCSLPGETCVCVYGCCGMFVVIMIHKYSADVLNNGQNI